MEQKGNWKGRITKLCNTRVRKVIAILLILAGIGAILSAIIVPVYNKMHNEAIIKKIREGSYAKKQAVATDLPKITDSTPATDQAAGISDTALSAEEKEQLERERKANQILQSQDVMGIVKIDKIGIEYAIVEGSENANIRGAVGHLKNTASIGQQGNCVIAGHRGGYYGEFFKNLDKLELDDVIKLTDTNKKEYLYSVYEIKVINPGDWSVTQPLSDAKTLTLLTCEDNATKRIAVSAILFSER